MKSFLRSKPAITGLMVTAGVFLFAACTSNSPTATPLPPTPKPTATAAPAADMMMQPGADKMKVAILSPADGTKVTANSVALKVSTSGFDNTCDLAGKPNQEGKGHYHVEIDKSLVNMFCTPEATISMQDVKPGIHTLTVLPAQDDHAEVHDNAVSIKIDYQPTSPLSTLTDATFPGKPTVKIVSPKPGATVSGSFDVVVEVQNFNLSCDLMGKPALAGYGHWHLNLDTQTGPMMGMGTMAGMSCEKTFHASTAGLASGSTHTLIALLTDTGHAPFNPGIFDQVDVKVQ